LEGEGGRAGGRGRGREGGRERSSQGRRAAREQARQREGTVLNARGRLGGIGASEGVGKTETSNRSRDEGIRTITHPELTRATFPPRPQSTADSFSATFTKAHVPPPTLSGCRTCQPPFPHNLSYMPLSSHSKAHTLAHAHSHPQQPQFTYLRDGSGVCLPAADEQNLSATQEFTRDQPWHANVTSLPS